MTMVKEPKEAKVSRRRLSEEDVYNIAILVAQGKNVNEISKAIGCTRLCVYKWCKRLEASGIVKMPARNGDVILERIKQRIAEEKELLGVVETQPVVDEEVVVPQEVAEDTGPPAA